MLFIKKDKRGLSVIGVIGDIVIGVFLLLILLYATRNLFGFLSEENEKATINNFNYLVEIANTKLKDKPYFNNADSPLAYYINNQFILVGFNKDDLGSEDECQTEFVRRPAAQACKDSACLCLYPETFTDNDFDPEDLPRICKAIDADYIFTLDYYQNGNIMYTDKEAIYKNILGPESKDIASKYYTDKYARLFIYGQCEDFGGDDENFGIQKLYIEKLYDKELNRTLLFIADTSVAEQYNKRLEQPSA